MWINRYEHVSAAERAYASTVRAKRASDAATVFTANADELERSI